MKMIKRYKAPVLITFLLIASPCAFAQQGYKYKAYIPVVKTDGFYRINLSPVLLAKCKAGFADIRLLNENGKTIPYIFGNSLPDKQLGLLNLPKVEDTASTDSLTSFIAENKDRMIIDQLSVMVRNTVVNRTFNLTGSDNLKTWYAISENVALDHARFKNDRSDFYEQLLSFPASRYHYLRIQIYNKNKEPIEILKLGTYRIQSENSECTRLPNAAVVQHDSFKKSTVFIKFNDNYPINKLRFTFNGQKYFKRNITIYQGIGKSFSFISDTVLSSADTTGLIISAKTNVIKLEIVNGDNPALSLASVIAYQLKQSLIGYLEKGHHYQIAFGNQKALAPDYDIKFFPIA
jgi:hypothetical protein